VNDQAVYVVYNLLYVVPISFLVRLEILTGETVLRNFSVNNMLVYLVL